MCVHLVSLQNPLVFFFLISNSRGPVPAPLTSGLHYYTTLEELRKSFDLCEDYFKPPFGPYPEKR